MIICTGKNLLAGAYTESNFKITFVQMGKRQTFADLKKRLVDVLIHAGEAEATVEKIRLWSCSSKEKLL